MPLDWFRLSPIDFFWSTTHCTQTLDKVYFPSPIRAIKTNVDSFILPSQIVPVFSARSQKDLHQTTRTWMRTILQESEPPFDVSIPLTDLVCKATNTFFSKQCSSQHSNCCVWERCSDCAILFRPPRSTSSRSSSSPSRTPIRSQATTTTPRKLFAFPTCERVDPIRCCNRPRKHVSH